jgi:hypothetical protein
LALLGSFGSTFGEAKVEKRKKHRIVDGTCIMNNTNESFIDFLRADYFFCELLWLSCKAIF